jgi:hypothetical protein
VLEKYREGWCLATAWLTGAVFNLRMRLLCHPAGQVQSGRSSRYRFAISRELVLVSALWRGDSRRDLIRVRAFHIA